MRTLVEQTRDEIHKWVEELANAKLLRGNKPRIIVLMGGEEINSDARDWDVHPEADTILIGTQDMLLSRALNRGYGMSRARWPMHFAFLNNDCLWVMDEVQLMGPGLACTTQLEGFRMESSGLGSINTHSWWMSATIRPDWLETVDFPANLKKSPPVTLLDAEKHDDPRIKALRHAPKNLTKASESSGNKAFKAVATYVIQHRSQSHLNLVVVNTVRRARELHQALSKQVGLHDPAPILLHSQFRPLDRKDVLAAVHSATPGQIVVSTQVIEAGVDLSAHALFTELAPWSSLVQRFGRCNRKLVQGKPHFADASIHWFDLDENKESAPYDPTQLAAARERLITLDDACLAKLENLTPPDADRPQFRHVIRRKDLVELFDTTPDLAGADLDIDRFIRDADSSNVQLFWRNWSANTPNGDTTNEPEPAPRREELCSTAIGELKALLEKQKQIGSAWRWSYIEREWQSVKPESLIPGQIYLLHGKIGGYSAGTTNHLPIGWTGDPKETVIPFPSSASANTPDASECDQASEMPSWQTVTQHTEAVCLTMEDLLAAFGETLNEFGSSVSIHAALRHAARWHDWGKAHPAFQAKLKPEALAAASLTGHAAKAPKEAWAKSHLPAKPTPDDPRRRHFRHELASALGILHPESEFPITEEFARNLAAYLVAAHHGKVRLSIRSLQDEWAPPINDDFPDERRFACGLWDGDVLPPCDLGGGVTTPTLTLSLEPMELGLCEKAPFENQPSWTERVLILRETLGVFRLAFLETLLRCADARASSNRP